MKESASTTRQMALFIGDALVLALMTVVGFASHDLIGSDGGTGLRMLTTFLPFLAAWLLVAPHVGVFNPGYVTDGRQLWRPFWAMVLAAPFGALLRGIWLGTPILPVFVAVVGGLNALALLAWRTVFLLFASRMRRVHG